MDIQEASFYWMAGLLEGEVSFGLLPPSGRKITPVLNMAIQMTDEDVIARFCDLIQAQYLALKPFKDHWAPLYLCRLRGKRAFQMMQLFYPLMGQRRQQQIVYACEHFVYRTDNKGTNNTRAKLTETDVVEIKRRIATGETAKEIAPDFGVTHYTIWGIRSGKTWKHVDLSDKTPVKDDSAKEIHIVSPISSTEQKFYWLAGLLEGEGSFMAPSPSSPNQPRISLQMTDEDVVAKAAQLFEKKYHRVEPKKPTHKAVYMLTVKGAQAANWMKELVPLMSRRRQEQIKRALENYRPR